MTDLLPLLSLHIITSKLNIKIDAIIFAHIIFMNGIFWSIICKLAIAGVCFGITASQFSPIFCTHSNFYQKLPKYLLDRHKINKSDGATKYQINPVNHFQEVKNIDQKYKNCNIDMK